MPKIITFNNRRIVEPGAYSQIVGGDTAAIAGASTGNVMIIDTGSGASFGYGSGVTGSNSNAGNAKSVYTFDNLTDAQKAVRGGIIWDILTLLFNPSKNAGTPGASTVSIIRAATTTRSLVNFTWTGGGCISSPAGGGTLSFGTVSEGLGSVGTLTSSELTRGFAMKMVAGVDDTAKFKLQVWVGTFKGLDSNNIPFDEILEVDCKPILLTQSPEFSNISTVIDWAKNNFELNQYFYLVSSTVTGTGVVDSGDLANYPGYTLATGGTETYGAGDYTNVLAAIREVDNTFFLSDKYGDNAQDSKNTLLLAHINTSAEFDKFMFVGGGIDATKFTQTNGSIPTAAFFNSKRVHVVHSGIRRAKATGLGYKDYNTLYHAAAACGREAGLAPQVPSTWKDLNVIGVTHELTLAQREFALLSGVMHLRNVADLGFVINQDVNTLQKNESQIYPDGSSPDGSIMRIAADLNKELTLNLRTRFVGKNAATASPTDVKAFVDSYLYSRTASKTIDNLILSYKNIVVNLKGSDYEITYSFTPNGPINRLFTTGFMFSVNLSA